MRGFTLIELMVTLAILAMLLLMAAPLAADWVHGARTLQARGTLVQGFENAKALALRNPCGAPNETQAYAAVLQAKLDVDGTTVTLNVRAQHEGAVVPPGVSGCALLDARPDPQWTARLPEGVSLTLNGTLLTSGTTPPPVKLDNRGVPTTSTSFILRRGGHQNDETGTLH